MLPYRVSDSLADIYLYQFSRLITTIALPILVNNGQSCLHVSVSLIIVHLKTENAPSTLHRHERRIGLTSTLKRRSSREV